MLYSPFAKYYYLFMAVVNVGEIIATIMRPNRSETPIPDPQSCFNPGRTLILDFSIHEPSIKSPSSVRITNLSCETRNTKH